jgi:putative ABC transport system permease protein
VVVVNEVLAAEQWPDGSALGARLRLTTDIDTLWRTVVGVVGPVRHGSLAEEARPAMYLPHAQFPSTSDLVMRSMGVVARTSAGPAALAARIREEVRAVDPEVPVTSLASMEDVREEATAVERFQGALFGLFAAIAIALVVVGVYGLTAYLVGRRTRELGVRTALGATPGDLLRLVLREGLGLAAVGVAAGLVGALALSRLLSGLLFGVEATDPLTFAAVPALLALTALAATAVPARRAARVEPMTALREE